MSIDQKDCLKEAKDFFAKLNSLKEESHQHYSSIIDSYSKIIITGISDLLEEVCGLKDEVSSLKREKTLLLETVESLNGEISKLRENLQSEREPKEELDNKFSKVEQNENEILKYPARDLESPSTNIKRENEDQEAGELYDLINNSAMQVQNEDIIDDKLCKESLFCPECKFEFSSNENLSLHMKDLHSISAKPEEDNESDEGGNSKSSETLPIHLHGSNYLEKCKLCPYGSNYAKAVKRHMKAVHFKIRSNACSDCDYVSSEKSALKRHRILVHKIGHKLEEFKCEKCQYKTVLRADFKRHVKGVHYNIRNHVCGDCGYAAKHKSTLKRHILSLHTKGSTNVK